MPGLSWTSSRSAAPTSTFPGQDHDYAIAVGLRMLVLRHLVEESEGLYRTREQEQDMLRYYANSIVHFFEE